MDDLSHITYCNLPCLDLSVIQFSRHNRLIIVLNLLNILIPSRDSHIIPTRKDAHEIYKKSNNFSH